MRKSKIICIDIETTGLDRNNDEILQVSIINGRGKTLYNSYIKPDYATEWKEAEEINKISWDCVKLAPGILTEKRKIDKILRKAELIIGYNHKGFDLPFFGSQRHRHGGKGEDLRRNVRICLYRRRIRRETR